MVEYWLPRENRSALISVGRLLRVSAQRLAGPPASPSPHPSPAQRIPPQADPPRPLPASPCTPAASPALGAPDTLRTHPATLPPHPQRRPPRPLHRARVQRSH